MNMLTNTGTYKTIAHLISKYYIIMISETKFVFLFKGLVNYLKKTYICFNYFFFFYCLNLLNVFVFGFLYSLKFNIKMAIVLIIFFFDCSCLIYCFV